VQAEELTGTLKKIKDTGTLTLGAPDSNIPFAYLDDKQQHVGYSIDLCMKIAAALQKQLGMDKLNVEVRSVTTSTRIPLIQNGSIDIDCDSATNTAERQKQVAFAPTDFIATARLVAKKASNIHTLKDMKGKTIVSTAGSSNMEQIVQLNRDEKLGMTIISAKDHAQGFLTMATGRAVAFAMDDILVAGLIANSKNPDDYAITDEVLLVEPSGFILRRDDPAFKHAVDAALSNIYHSSEITTIYNKWFMSPIPPKGINLNLPMSERLKAVFANPTDSSDPNHYK
jgi:glutamate/aspartate transport system substrate-binding protein